jgi:hypothetical protein
MRMMLAKRPVRLETILYSDWRKKLMAADSRAARPRPTGGMRLTRNRIGRAGGNDAAVPF